MGKNPHSSALHKILTGLWFWAPPFIWAGFIYALSSRPAAEFPQITFVPYADKAVHTAEYGILGFLLARALSFQAPERNYLQLGAIALVLCIAYGYSDELHQRFVATRTFDLFDLSADALGSLAGIIFAKLLIQRVR
jgi:VanZ family protein